MDNAYALIMAGGSGTRLWPLSRRDRPKPVLHLVEEERSMFQISVERLHPLFPPERILVVANAQLTKLLKAQAPQLPAENFIVEPVGRDTAPAVGLGAIHIRRRDPDGVMAVLAADHYIADTAIFRKVLATACQVAAQGLIVTLGISPDFPSTGFGYIERGERDQTVDGTHIYVLERFAEKPDRATAESFLASGNYSWNSGMFIWPVRRVMAEFEKHTPTLYAQLEELAVAIGQPGYDDLLGKIWPSLEKISVDFALMEHIQEGLRVIPVQMGWVDIGSFSALYDILSDKKTGNAFLGFPPLEIDTHRTLIYSERLVATIGLDDLVIVDTDDVLLVCHRDRAQDVRELVEELKRKRLNKYL
jgi:mannose-1-phosphate guanylyltransferase